MVHISGTTIRRAREKDFKPIEAILRDSGLMYEAGERAGMDFYFDRIYFEDLLRKPSERLCLVAETNGEVVGVVLARPRWNRDLAFLDRIAVRADKRRMGIGHALNMAVIQKCDERGATSIFTYINPENDPSHAMLALEGFTIGKGQNYLHTATKLMGKAPIPLPA